MWEWRDRNEQLVRGAIIKLRRGVSNRYRFEIIGHELLLAGIRRRRRNVTDDAGKLMQRLLVVVLVYHSVHPQAGFKLCDQPQSFLLSTEQRAHAKLCLNTQNYVRMYRSIDESSECLAHKRKSCKSPLDCSSMLVALQPQLSETIQESSGYTFGTVP